MNIEPFALPSDYATKMERRNERLNIRRAIFYCPVCARLGFHALFHQIDYFTKCLLHGVELHRLERKSTKRFNRIVDQQVADAYELLFGEASEWSFQECASWTPDFEMAGWEYVKDLLSIVSNAHKQGSLKDDQLIDRGERFCTAVDMLRRLYWPKALPERIGCCLQQEDDPMTPVTTRFIGQPRGNPALGDAWRQIHHVSALLTARRLWVRLTGENVGWRQMAQRCVDEMFVGHTRCWASFSRFHTLLDCRDDPYDIEEIGKICPRVIGIQKLQQQWLFTRYFREAEYGGTADWDISVGSALAAVNLAERVRVPLVMENPYGVSQVFDVSAWRLRDKHLQAIVDAINTAKLLDDIWNLWQREMDSRFEGDGSATRDSYGTQWYLFQVNSDIVELQIWSQTPRHLPNWAAVNRAGHHGEKRLWKWAVLRNHFQSRLRSWDPTWMSSAEAETIAAASWKIEGKRWVENNCGPHRE